MGYGFAGISEKQRYECKSCKGHATHYQGRQKYTCQDCKGVKRERYFLLIIINNQLIKSMGTHPYGGMEFTPMQEKNPTVHTASQVCNCKHSKEKFSCKEC